MPQDLPRGGAVHEREVRQQAQRKRRAHRRDGGRGDHLFFFFGVFTPFSAPFSAAFAYPRRPRRVVRVHRGRRRRVGGRRALLFRRVRLDGGDERLDHRRKRRRRLRGSLGSRRPGRRALPLPLPILGLLELRGGLEHDRPPPRARRALHVRALLERREETRGVAQKHGQRRRQHLLRVGAPAGGVSPGSVHETGRVSVRGTQHGVNLALHRELQRMRVLHDVPQH